MDWWNDIQDRKKANERSKAMKDQVTSNIVNTGNVSSGVMRYNQQGRPDPKGRVEAPYDLTGPAANSQRSTQQLTQEGLEVFAEGRQQTTQVMESIKTPEGRAAIVQKYLEPYKAQIKNETDREMMNKLEKQLILQLEQMAREQK